MKGGTVCRHTYDQAHRLCVSTRASGKCAWARTLSSETTAKIGAWAERAGRYDGGEESRGGWLGAPFFCYCMKLSELILH